MKCKLLIGAFAALAFVASAAEQPNIIFIYGDDIGYGDFSCYGGEVDTANIDTLAEEGVRFTGGYCTAATCTPSRYSLLTGEYAFRNKGAQILPGNAPLIIDPARPTIAAFLRDNGYKTALSGKWHLGLGSASEPLDWNGQIKPGPKEVGFEYSFHMAATADRVPSVYIKNGRVVNLDASDPIQVNYQELVGNDPTGISHPHLLKLQADEQHGKTIVNGVSRIGWMSGGNSARFKDEDMADTYLNKAVNFIIENSKPQTSNPKPFFLYFAPNENHVPRVVHPRFQGSTSLGPRGDALAVFDWCVGRLVQTLKETGQYENTLIVITSDNGPVLFDGYWEAAIERQGTHDASGPWRGGKYSRWEGGTRVPFIVTWPGKSKPGISDAIVSQVDLYASVAALIGKPVPENAGQDGENLLPTLLGDSLDGREYVIQEALTQIAVRKGNWKYIPPGSVTERLGIMTWEEGSGWKKTNVAEPGLLFHLSEDPTEEHDLAAKYPNRVQEMRDIIMQVAPEKATGQKQLDKKQLGF
ncbi:sulfatase family protein [Pontiella sulfatireligans]|uniref:Arylsulfatase n=1 Tax=Pontiella sulfatireligans TaxID=2750658 RepID=A0A6C2UKD0_9BACT|nr:arylsulfatase [Pontiella sulfatireligans]SPS74434.1 sulfatase S1_15 [Kiritimatiellales bacterium]VGO20690.1 Arylsulfatase [Pontiella sulfatireligans]